MYNRSKKKHFTLKIPYDYALNADTVDKELKLESNEEEKIDIVDEVGYHFFVDAFDVNPTNRIEMKKFLRGYPDITCDDDDEITENNTKIDSDTVYSEFKQPTISAIDEYADLDDISNILKRNFVLKTTDDKSKNRRSKFHME